MGNIDNLIREFCPNGVQKFVLNDIGQFYSGLSGKSKDDFKDGNEKFITYINIYSNPSLKIDVDDKVKINDGEKQNTIQYGDLLFTGSSETPDECGMCSVLTQKTEEKLYLNSFCFGYRFNDLSEINPSFMKHLFRSRELRKAIGRTANGVTRYNVSKKDFGRISIPVPPKIIQNKIADILDEFTEYTAELQAELQARKQQYEYYRNHLLTHFGDDQMVREYSLGEFGKLKRGKRLTKPQLVNGGKYKVYHGGIDPIGCYHEYNRDENTVMVINVGASAGTIGYSKEKFWSSDGCFCIPYTDTVLSKFLYYYLQNNQKFLMTKVRHAGIPTLDSNVVESMKLKIPKLEEQRRIVSILDKFEELVNDLSSGLPAEIEAVQQQYEYYRNKLLTFKTE